MRVASLHIHPVKGTRAVDVNRATLSVRGLDGDRRWMIADERGVFMSQRSHPQLARITATFSGDGLVLSAAGFDGISVPRPRGGERAEVMVWSDQVSVASAGEAAHAWLTRVIGEPATLVCMDEISDRKKTGPWVPAPIPLSFADAFPVLVATTGSLAALNAEIERSGGTAVPMARFRPNVVIDCDEAWREDFWKVLRIGEIELELMKASDRCVVTTTDQTSGARMGPEPLASLMRLRLSADPRINGVVFGWNAAPRKLGMVRVGDAVEVVATRPEGFAVRASVQARA